MKGLLYIGIGLIAVKYLSNRATGARYLTGIRMQIKGVTPVGLNELQITFNIDNPNSKPSVVKSVVGDIYVNNTKAARVQTYNNVTVGGNAQTTYPVTAKLNILRAVQSITELFKGVAGNTIRFVGTANIDDVAQSLNIAYKL